MLTLTIMLCYDTPNVMIGAYRYQLPTKREAINFALRTLAAEPASVDEARSLRGIGWEGDLDLMRSTRAP